MTTFSTGWLIPKVSLSPFPKLPFRCSEEGSATVAQGGIAELSTIGKWTKASRTLHRRRSSGLCPCHILPGPATLSLTLPRARERRQSADNRSTVQTVVVAGRTYAPFSGYPPGACAKRQTTPGVKKGPNCASRPRTSLGEELGRPGGQTHLRHAEIVEPSPTGNGHAFDESPARRYCPLRNARCAWAVETP